MAVTKVLARKGRLDVGIHYVLNGDKTNEQILTAYLNCDPSHACRQMLDTKRAMGKTDGVQYYHIIQSFKPGEVTPELALEIAREFAAEHLPGYQAVIGVQQRPGPLPAHAMDGMRLVAVVAHQRMAGALPLQRGVAHAVGLQPSAVSCGPVFRFALSHTIPLPLI